MSRIMEIVVKAQDKASGVLERVGEKGSNAARTLEDNWMKVTAVTSATALGIESMARSQQELTEATNRLASATSMTNDEVRDMATELSDVTLPMEEVVGLMETARSQGLQTREEIESFVEVWDMVGDATGESAEMLAEAGASLRAVGIQAGEEEQALASFGYIQRETTAEVSEFLYLLDRVGPEMQDLGLTIDDTAALMGAMERELGMTSRTARQELRQAMREADGDMEALRGELGLTNEQWEKHRDLVDENSDTIETNAEHHEESYTVMQRLQHRLSELNYQYGEQIAMVSNLTPMLLVMGPAIKGLSVAKGALTTATHMATVATVKYAIATKSLLIGPLGLLLVAIAGIIAISWVLYKNWDTISEGMSDLWEGFVSFFEGTWKALTGLMDDTLSFWSSAWESFVSGLTELFTGFRDFIVNMFEGLKEVLLGPIRLAIEGANSLIRGMNNIQVEIPDWVPGVGGGTFGIDIPEIPRLWSGGVATREQIAMVGDRDEAILPLDPLKAGTREIERLLKEIHRSLSEGTQDRRGTAGPNIHVGTLVADESGLRALERKLKRLRIQEDRRVGDVL